MSRLGWSGLALLVFLDPGSGAQAAGDPLRAYLESFASLGPIHVSATASIDRRLDDGRHVEGAGDYEYWDDGSERYRITCTTDSILGLAGDSDLSFDGNQARVRVEDVMSILDTNPTQTAAALPNPLLLAVDFVRPRWAECNSCRFNLRDVPAGGRALDARPVVTEGAREIRYEIERPALGDSHPAESYSIRMREIQPERWAPVEIEHRRPDFSSTISFSEFAAFGDFVYPRTVVARSSDERGLLAVLVMRIAAVVRPEDDDEFRVPGIADKPAPCDDSGPTPPSAADPRGGRRGER